VANALAYYDTTTITAVKCFIVQAPDDHRLRWFHHIKLFTLVTHAALWGASGKVFCQKCLQWNGML